MRRTWNEVFILFNWVMLALSILVGSVTSILWLAGGISDRAMIGIGMVLGFLSITLGSWTALLTAYVKDGVE